jgi:phosphoadenosine phosphosulfate reductase
MTQEQINNWNQILEGKGPKEILEFIFNEFNGKIGFATSLGAEDQLLTHMLAPHFDKCKIFTLDTGRTFPENYELLQNTISRYKTNIDVYFPEAAKVEEMVNSKGINLFYESIENRKLCCNVRKIAPLKRALSDLDAWIVGLRREQSVTRQDMQIVEWDEMNQMVKFNPLINYTEEQLWDEIKEENVPYSKLHDLGFPSIGCQPCTRAIEKGEDVRAGRWWWENPEQKECGLHKK